MVCDASVTRDQLEVLLANLDQYITVLLPSANAIVLEMFCGVRYTHDTFTLITKQH